MNLHIISSLNVGGAERVLSSVCKRSPSNQIVVTLLNSGFYGKDLSNNGVRIISLNATPLTVLFYIPFLIFIMYKYNVKTLMTWMFHSNLLALFLKLSKPSLTIYWNIRLGHVPSNMFKVSRFIVIKLNYLLSYFIPDRIFYCGPLTMQYHVKMGINKKISSSISNGFPEVYVCPVYIKRESNTFNIGMVARSDPQKDHLTLLKALRLLQSSFDFKLFLTGSSLSQSSHIFNLIKYYDLENHVVITDHISDMISFYQSLDLHILSTFSEGFPNVVGESMSNSIVTIGSNVSDIPSLITNPLLLFEVGDSVSLASKILELYSLSFNQNEWIRLRIESSTYIKNNFSFDTMIDSYLNVLN